MNYAEIIQDNRYFVDKTRFIAQMEPIKNPVYLRPRRFGKSLFCSMLQYYYDLRHASQFEELFKDTWIGDHPTKNHNKFIVLKLDLSEITVSDNPERISYNFTRYCTGRLLELKLAYPEYISDMPDIKDSDDAATTLSLWLGHLLYSGAPKVYVIIDEYDNFANQLITSYQDQLYDDITSGDSFLRTFFKVLKAGRQNGSIETVFITGVLPITIDDLTSSYNIGTFLTLEPAFEQMLGFTQTEVNALLDEIFKDYKINPGIRSYVDEVIKNQYDGYHFVSADGEAVYNSTMLMYFLRQFCEDFIIPKQLTDLNLRTDLSWVKRITSTTANTEEIVSELLRTERIPYNEDSLVTKFNKDQFFDKEYYPISLYYLGMLTKKDQFSLTLPNMNMKKIFAQYFNELFHIDSSSQYEQMIRSFIEDPDLERLFSDYWKLYIKILPEAIFTQVNENFYRTTFYELCSRYLSTWFTWNIERSYPKGRSDLEFVGKFNEKFAGIRWVIEFKYLSNTEFSKMKCPIDSIPLREEDTIQITGYAEGLKQEYPEVSVRLFVIYCIGNQGFKVYSLK